MWSAEPGTRSALRPLLTARGRKARLAISGRPQAGQSLVEVVVAAALMGVGIVTGLESVATAERVSSAATAQARATCAVRAEAQFLEATPWNDQATYQLAAGIAISSSSPQAGLQVLTVSTGGASATVYKAHALSPVTGPSQVDTSWCDQLSGPGQ